MRAEFVWFGWRRRERQLLTMLAIATTMCMFTGEIDDDDFARAKEHGGYYQGNCLYFRHIWL